jgi:hypothetical protein
MILALFNLAACGDGASEGVEDSQPVNEASASGGFDNSAWSRALELYARDGGLDYAALAADRSDLDAFLGGLEAANPAGWSTEEQIAFWSNAYNAVVAEYVLELYPGIESVKDVDGFFNKKTRLVAGEELTLDEIEGRARDLGDPRVHFAVVCASTSCPDLLAEPFDPRRLEQQLEQQTQLFLLDPSKGLRYDADQDVLWLSSIFKWYGGDFTGGSTVVAFVARNKVVEWVRPHLPEELAAALEGKTPSVKFLDYDWSLNDR